MSFLVSQPVVAASKVGDFALEAMKEHLVGEKKEAPQEGEKLEKKEGKAPRASNDAAAVPDDAQRGALTNSAKVTILFENVKSIDVTSADRHALVGK